MAHFKKQTKTKTFYKTTSGALNVFTTRSASQATTDVFLKQNNKINCINLF